MKRELGFTFTNIMIYIVVFMAVMTIAATINSFYYQNVDGLQGRSETVAEYSKFNMFFIDDIKNNNQALIVSPTRIQFEDGTIYYLSGSSIYRNDVKIANSVKNVQFAIAKENDKNMISLFIQFENQEIEYVKSCDYVLGRGY